MNQGERNMAIPMVTIAVPVYNGANYLEESLGSLLEQEFDDFEIIIGDNGSTDRTPEICMKFANSDGRISYHRSPVNRGAAWNYNRLFAVASGRYFKWASHDDKLASQYLNVCVKALEEAPQAVIAFPQTVLIGPDGERLKVHKEHWDVRDPRPSKRLRHAINQHGLHNVIFGLMRSDAVRTTNLIGRFDGSDIVLLSELALRGEFHNVPGELFLRRIHPNMSRRALKNPRDVANWFDTSARAYYFTWTRLYFETMRAVARAPISLDEKSRSYALVTQDWQWKRLAREWYQTARELTWTARRDRYEDFSEPVEQAS
jgi:glycosyltransferase involved in cell wall biosynthesis